MKSLGMDKQFLKKKEKTARYRFLEAIYLSFFSRHLYVDVIRHWRGFGVLYLFVMLSVVVLPCAVRMMTAYQQSVEQKLFIPIKKLPPFSIRGGEVQFHSPMPYLVKNERDEVIALIDTEGKVKQLPYFLYPEASILITKRAIHTRLPHPDFFKQGDLKETKETVMPFQVNENTDFVGEDWLPNSQLKQINQLLMFSLYFVLLMLYFGMYFIILFSCSLFGQFIAHSIFKVQLTFKETARLVAVAATPQAIVYFCLLTIDKVYPGTGIFYIASIAFYFSVGVLAYRRDNRAIGMILK